MKIYSYSQARQNLAEVLNRAKAEEVVIRRRSGELFRIVPQEASGSPFDVPGIRTKVKTSDILEAIREVRSRES